MATTRIAHFHNDANRNRAALEKHLLANPINTPDSKSERAARVKESIGNILSGQSSNGRSKELIDKEPYLIDRTELDDVCSCYDEFRTSVWVSIRFAGTYE